MIQNIHLILNIMQVQADSAARGRDVLPFFRQHACVVRHRIPRMEVWHCAVPPMGTSCDRHLGHVPHLPAPFAWLRRRSVQKSCNVPPLFSNARLNAVGHSAQMPAARSAGYCCSSCGSHVCRSSAFSVALTVSAYIPAPYWLLQLSSRPQW